MKGAVDMTQPKPFDDNESRLADIFKEGFKRFRSEIEEEEAKNKAANTGTDKGTDGNSDATPPVSWTDRLLGVKPGK